VDLMLELGVLKAIFIHLLRILDWTDGMHIFIVQAAATLMAVRFRVIPPFGRGGVRKTRSNRSESKKMTAHDYEDMLQVRMDSFK
jgi:hypothetical protein